MPTKKSRVDRGERRSPSLTLEVRKRGSDSLRVAIADPSNLIYSDDYREGWKHGFEAFADVKVFDIGPLAKPSLYGRGPYSSKGWPNYPKQLADQIIRWTPDLLWCHHGRAASSEQFIDRVKQARIKTGVYLCDEPYESGETLRYARRFDFVFTMDPCTIPPHKAAGSKHVFYLPPGVEVGRFDIARAFVDRPTPALFLGNATLTPRPPFLRTIERHVPGAKILYWKTTRKGEPGWVGIDKYPQLYAGTKIGLNIHRDPSMSQECFTRRVRQKKHLVPAGYEQEVKAPLKWGTGFWNDLNLPAQHVNPRFFEMAAAGCLVVSDSTRFELARMFPSAPRAEDPDHFLELVLYYLENLAEAEAIGHQCKQQVSSLHTYRHRAAEVLIRAGLLASSEVNRFTSLGEPLDWLTPQDFNERGESLSWAPTGAFARFDPAFGRSQMGQSGRPSRDGSLSFRPAWLP